MSTLALLTYVVTMILLKDKKELREYLIKYLGIGAFIDAAFKF